MKDPAGLSDRAKLTRARWQLAQTLIQLERSREYAEWTRVQNVALAMEVRALREAIGPRRVMLLPDEDGTVGRPHLEHGSCKVLECVERVPPDNLGV